MKDHGVGEPIGGYLLDPVPRNFVPVAAPIKRPLPESNHMFPEYHECVGICRHRVIVEEASYDLLQPATLIGDRMVSAPS